MRSERRHMVGFHVTKKVRDKLRQEARVQKISVSLFMYKLLLEKFQMPDELAPEDAPLEEMLKQ